MNENFIVDQKSHRKQKLEGTLPWTITAQEVSGEETNKLYYSEANGFKNLTTSKNNSKTHLHIIDYGRQNMLSLCCWTSSQKHSQTRSNPIIVFVLWARNCKQQLESQGHASEIQIRWWDYLPELFTWEPLLIIDELLF